MIMWKIRQNQGLLHGWSYLKPSRSSLLHAEYLLNQSSRPLPWKSSPFRQLWSCFSPSPTDNEFVSCLFLESHHQSASHTNSLNYFQGSWIHCHEVVHLQREKCILAWENQQLKPNLVWLHNPLIHHAQLLVHPLLPKHLGSSHSWWLKNCQWSQRPL